MYTERPVDIIYSTWDVMTGCKTISARVSIQYSALDGTK